tara:strand:- start:3842 stop:4300 length:459 start_codon:yes stop_codon:yes gene_type:complete
MAIPRSILVAVDTDALSLEALRRAVERAALFGAKVRIVHVYASAAPAPPIPLPGAAALHQEAQRALEDEVRRKVEAFLPTDELAGVEHSLEIVRHASPGEALCELASKGDVDLLLVGSHHRTGLGRVFLGSVAERVVRTAPCDVLVVRAATD